MTLPSQAGMDWYGETWPAYDDGQRIFSNLPTELSLPDLLGGGDWLKQLLLGAASPFYLRWASCCRNPVVVCHIKRDAFICATFRGCVDQIGVRMVDRALRYVLAITTTLPNPAHEPDFTIRSRVVEVSE
jgi:hypothetical protein